MAAADFIHTFRTRDSHWNRLQCAAYAISDSHPNACEYAATFVSRVNVSDQWRPQSAARRRADRQRKNLSEYVWNDIVLGIHVCSPVARTHSDVGERFSWLATQCTPRNSKCAIYGLQFHCGDSISPPPEKQKKTHDTKRIRTESNGVVVHQLCSGLRCASAHATIHNFRENTYHISSVGPSLSGSGSLTLYLYCMCAALCACSAATSHSLWPLLVWSSVQFTFLSTCSMLCGLHQLHLVRFSSSFFISVASHRVFF